MNTAITTQNQPSALPSTTLRPLPTLPHDPEAGRLLSWCESGADKQSPGQPLQLVNWPSREQRDVLVRRQRALSEHLAKVDNRAIGAAVADLMRSFFQTARLDQNAARSMTAKYVADLAGVPTWACVRACNAIKEGRVADVSLDHPPSSPRLRQVAESYITTVREEVLRLNRVLRAEKVPAPVSAEQRQHVHAGLRALADHLRALPDARVVATDDKAKKQRAEIDAILAKSRGREDAQ